MTQKIRRIWIAALSGSLLFHLAVISIGMFGPKDSEKLREAPASESAVLEFQLVSSPVVERPEAPERRVAPEVPAQPRLAIRPRMRPVVVPPPVVGIEAPAKGASEGEVRKDVLEVFRTAGSGLTPRVPFVPQVATSDRLAFAPAPTIGSRIKPPEELNRIVKGYGGVAAQIADDGSISFKAPGQFSDPKLWIGKEVVGVHLTFDLTEMAMNAAGMDPHVSEKRRISEVTRERRLCMAERDQDRRRSEALFNMKNTLASIIGAVEQSWTERREAILDLWDGCTQGAGHDGQDLAVAARATIIKFVRERLPAGGDHAFTLAELVGFNQRRSHGEIFDPYGSAVRGPSSEGP